MHAQPHLTGCSVASRLLINHDVEILPPATLRGAVVLITNPAAEEAY
jgi:hypothetical protein